MVDRNAYSNYTFSSSCCYVSYVEIPDIGYITTGWGFYWVGANMLKLSLLFFFCASVSASIVAFS